MEDTPLKAAVTPEILEQGIRLADIMMPCVMKQTRELFLAEAGPDTRTPRSLHNGGGRSQHNKNQTFLDAQHQLHV